MGRFRLLTDVRPSRWLGGASPASRAVLGNAAARPGKLAVVGGVVAFSLWALSGCGSQHRDFTKLGAGGLESDSGGSAGHSGKDSSSSAAGRSGHGSGGSSAAATGGAPGAVAGAVGEGGSAAGESTQGGSAQGGAAHGGAGQAGAAQGGQGGGAVVLSNDAALSALVFDSGSISFASATTAYTLHVDDAIATIKVKPTANNAGATIKVNGVAVASGANSAAIPVAQANTTAITITVLAQDGVTSKTYSVSVTRNGWAPVGSAGFSPVGVGAVSIALGTGNAPNVAYADAGNTKQLSVMSWSGTAWGAVGPTAFSMGEAAMPSLAMSGNIPYVIFIDKAQSSRANVMYYNGSTWSSLDFANTSAAAVGFAPSIKISGSRIDIAYSDASVSGKATAKNSYNNSNWATYGSLGFTPTEASYVKFDSGYVAYRAGSGISPLNVYQWNNTWSLVGPANISSEDPLGANEYDFFVWGGNPFVVYTSTSNNFALYCKVYNPTTKVWDLRNPGKFSPSSVGSPKLQVIGAVSYVAFKDGLYGNRISVMKLVGNSDWVYFGAPGSISASDVDSLSFVMADENTMFVAFPDKAQFGKLTVMKYLTVP
ncbi:MAG TPA: cadherin-like beta sandwich domain-containing protein [Polyangiaceae bacterium]|nr:cadherin-like beta sandwich domain-containing protein [Polyangiaceae bacterium]